MTFAVDVVADSVNHAGNRLTTFQVRYPRFIHSELMTHRMLSRNASSSRAIPVNKQLARILADPAMPVEWGKNKPGMQAAELLTDEQVKAAMDIWIKARDASIAFSQEMNALNIHKQITNRIAEPFSHIAVIVSGTEWANFFALRDHPDAQPEFQVLARHMAVAYAASEPKKLTPHVWHLPYVQDSEHRMSVSIQLKLSVARCARVSYMNHDGTEPDIEEDLKLHDRLAVQKPLHASPCEHQATPFYLVDDDDVRNGIPMYGYPYDVKWDHRAGRLDLGTPWSANYRGWFQYRQSLRNQNVETAPVARTGYGVDGASSELTRALATFAHQHAGERSALGELADRVLLATPHIQPLFAKV